MLPSDVTFRSIFGFEPSATPATLIGCPPPVSIAYMLPPDCYVVNDVALRAAPVTTWNRDVAFHCDPVAQPHVSSDGLIVVAVFSFHLVCAPVEAAGASVASAVKFHRYEPRCRPGNRRCIGLDVMGRTFGGA